MSNLTTNQVYSNVIALTGCIGSGKSTVSGMLAKLGCHIISADELSKSLVTKGTETLTKLKQLFGDSIITEQGNLDRKRLAEIIFKDPIEKRKLEDFLHPKIRDLAFSEFTKAIADGKKIIIYDVPLYFEAGLYNLNFKAVVTVYAPKDICLSRVIARDKITKDQALERMASQLSIEDKIKKSNYVVDNSRDLKHLENEVFDLYKKLCAL